MPKTRSRWCALHLGLDPARAIQIEDVGIVEIDVADLPVLVEVATEIQNGGTNERRRVAASCTGRYTLNLRERPEPRSVTDLRNCKLQIVNDS